MTDEQSSFRQIVKSTSILGGVQLFNIFIAIARSKIIAVLLGTTGFGIMGLLNSTISLIASLTNFGLNTSGVRSVSSISENEDKAKLSQIAAILRKLVILTGVLGALLTLISAPWLSRLTFGNGTYTISFILLSITLLFAQMNIGENALLQGTRNIKNLAKASLWGAFVSLIISIPIYYLFRFNGIVPAIIISSLITYFFTRFYAIKIKVPVIHIGFKKAIYEGRDILYMGLMLSFSFIITQATSYILRTYISHLGGLTEVGLYTAGFAIINNYVGMIFGAMATDFFPRLASVSKDIIKSIKIINQQAESTILILAPILIIFISFVNFVIFILYSNQFLDVSLMLQWAALGMFFKGASFPIAHIFLTKGDAKLYFINESIANLYVLTLNIVCYKYAGLDGIGFSFLIGYVLYFIQVYIVSKIKYGYKMSSQFVFLLSILFLITACCFLATILLSETYSFIVKIFLIIIVSAISVNELNKRLNIVDLIKDYKNR